MIMGTAAYMSPEQARGKPVDKRADIWAFGVVFLEMLTGRSPFEGETVSDTLAGVLRADVDLKTLPADTPPAIRRLIEHCLQKDPKRRLRDIGDAWIEIDSPAAPAVPVAAAPPPKTSRLPWIACGAAALIAIAAVAWA
jgi:eukaryotic-like serine/threonine-protein kinase